jgi:N-carbamoyl-L-amino-acid hydrolase
VNTKELTRLRAAVDRRLPMASRLFNELQERTTSGRGVTRASYRAGEQIGHDLMRTAAEEVGLEVTTDFAGNLYATLPGADRSLPRWISGSHLDSVPHGGNFDGAAGAIAALLAMTVLKDFEIRPAADMVAMGIRAEEASSWFSGRHNSHFGSRAALGLLDEQELDSAVHLETGQTLADSINAAGFDAGSIRQRDRMLTPKNVAGFIELHIEQGPVLIAAQKSAAIVTAIRGTIRARNARCVGAYSHSGAVPQEMRRDAVLATAELINRLESSCSELRTQGKDVVFAVGRLHTDAAADSLSKVPGLVNFTIDMRSQDGALLDIINSQIDELAVTIGSQRNISFDLHERTVAKPTTMDPSFRDTLRSAAEKLDLVAPEMPCGAGHDAAEFVRAGIPSSMLFVRNTGESHNPDEMMTLEDFRDGVLLLTSFLYAKTLPL